LSKHKSIKLNPCPICKKDVSIKQMSNGDDDIFFMVTRGNGKDKSCTCRLFMESELVRKDVSCEQKEKAKHDLVEAWNSRSEYDTKVVSVITSVTYSNKKNKHDYSKFVCTMSDGATNDFNYHVSNPIPRGYAIEGQTWEWLLGFMNGMWRQATFDNEKIEYVSDADNTSSMFYEMKSKSEILKEVNKFTQEEEEIKVIFADDYQERNFDEIPVFNTLADLGSDLDVYEWIHFDNHEEAGEYELKANDNLRQLSSGRIICTEY